MCAARLHPTPAFAEWSFDSKHGKGTLSWQADGPMAGAIYRGAFQNGVIEGKGQTSFADGSKYEGTYVDGQRHGRGTFTSPEGIIEERMWAHGRLVEPSSGGTDTCKAVVTELYSASAQSTPSDPFSSSSRISTSSRVSPTGRKFPTRRNQMPMPFGWHSHIAGKAARKAKASSSKSPLASYRPRRFESQGSCGGLAEGGTMHLVSPSDLAC